MLASTCLVIIIRPHRSTTYVETTYWYRRISVVCLFVCRSVCLLVCHDCEPCKTAEPIEMPFGLWTRVGPGNHVLNGGTDSTVEGASFGRKCFPLYSTTDHVRRRCGLLSNYFDHLLWPPCVADAVIIFSSCGFFFFHFFVA